MRAICLRIFSLAWQQLSFTALFFHSGMPKQVHICKTRNKSPNQKAHVPHIKKQGRGQKPCTCGPCGPMIWFMGCNASPTSPQVLKSCHCVSHLTTLFPGLSTFLPGYFRITSLKQLLSKHPACILLSSCPQIFYLILSLISNQIRQQWQPGADLSWYKQFVLKIGWEVQHGRCSL